MEPASSESAQTPASQRGSQKLLDLGPAWLRYPWIPLLAPLLVFSDGILGRVPYAPGDGFLLFIPWFTDSARAWLSGHLPTWNPWAQAGMPQLGSTQAGALYPPNLLFVVLPPILANNLTIVVTFLLAGTGAWLLARLLTGDNVAAAVGGLGFGFCTFLFAHVGHQSMDAGAAWLPWMVYGYELLRRRPSASRLLLAGGTVALALLSGHSQIFFIDLLILAVYAGGVTLLGKPSKPLRSAALAVLVVVVGLALGAVQLLPTIAVAQASFRSTISYADIAAYSLPKSHLPLLLFPFLFGDPGFRGGPYFFGYGGLWNPTELSGYPGAALLVLAACGLVALWSSRQARALVAVGAVCLVLAMGPSTPLGHLLRLMPIYGQFRAWGRYIVGLDFGVAMLAAFGVMILRRGAARERRVATLLAAGTAGGILLSAYIAPRIAKVRHFIPGGTPPAAALLLPCAAAVAGLVSVLVLRRTRPGWTRHLGPALVIAVVGLDLFFGFGGYYQWRQSDFTVAQLNALYSPATPLAWGPVSRTPGGIDRFLFVGTNVVPMVPNWVQVTDMKKIRTVNSNDALLSADFARAVGLTSYGQVTLTGDLWRQDSRVLDLLRVSTVVVDPPSAGGGPPKGSLLTGGVPVLGTEMRYTYTPRLPAAFLVGGVQKESFSQAVQALHGVHPFDPASVAIVDQACRACPTGKPGGAGTVDHVHWGINSVDVAVRPSRPGVFVLSQAYSPGWEASVDGRAAPVVRVDGVVQGVPVPAGARHVVLSYHAPGLRPGFFISLATLVGFLVAIVVGRMKRRRPAPGSP